MVEVGTTATVTTTVQPRSGRSARRRSRPSVVFVEHVDAQPVATWRVAPLHGGERAASRWRLQPTRRGTLTVGPLVAVVHSPLRLWQRRVVVADAVEVVALAVTVPLRFAPPAADSTGRRAPAATRVAGATETLRDYVSGDDPRRIHWRASAHRGQWVVRQPDTDARHDVVLVLDTSPEAHDGASFERAVSVTASLLTVAHRHGLRVDATTTAGTVLHTAHESTLDAALQRLARLQPEVGANNGAAGAAREQRAGVVVSGRPEGWPTAVIVVACRHHPAAGGSASGVVIDASDGLEAFATRWEAWARG